MSIRFAVLGLLAERPGYGYQLVQVLNERLGAAWQLIPSSVYAALETLESEGLIRARPTAGGDSERRTSTQRVVYETTLAGRTQFRQWLARPAPRQEPIRPEAALKLAVAPNEEGERIMRMLADEEHLTGEVLVQVEGEVKTLAEEGCEEAFPRRAAVERLRAELRWIEAARATLEDEAPSRLEKGASSRGP
jgi:DNA-binding PadR family transcriptional regulator